MRKFSSFCFECVFHFCGHKNVRKRRKIENNTISFLFFVSLLFILFVYCFCWLKFHFTICYKNTQFVVGKRKREWHCRCCHRFNRRRAMDPLNPNHVDMKKKTTSTLRKIKKQRI